MNGQKKGRGRLSGRLSALLMVLFLAFTLSSGMLGFLLGRNAARSSGKLMDTIVLSPGDSSRREQSATVHFISGTLRRRDGQPLEGAKVRLGDDGRSDVTDSKGRFYLSDVRSGEQLLEVEEENGAAKYSLPFSLDFTGTSVSVSEEENALQMPEETRLVEMSFTLEEDDSLVLEADSVCAVTRSGQVVNGYNKALRLPPAARAITPSGSLADGRGYVAVPHEGVVLAPTGEQFVMDMGVEIMPGVLPVENSSLLLLPEETLAVEETPQPGKSPSPTNTPEIENTPTSTSTPEIENTPTPTSTPEPKDTPIPTNTPGPKETPIPTNTPGLENTPTPTSTPEIENTPTPTSTPEIENTPTPTSTPEIENTPTPTSTPGLKETPEIEKIPEGGALLLPDGILQLEDGVTVGGDDNVILLENGSVQEIEKLPGEYQPPAEASPSEAPEGEEPSSEVTEPTPVPTVKGLEVADLSTGISWEQQSTIELFKNRVTKSGAKIENADGTIIQPGDRGYYDFRLENPESFDITYTVTIKEKTFHLPILYSVVDLANNKNYLRRERNGQGMEELVSPTITIPAQSVQEFRIEWAWQYEDWLDPERDDAMDTAGAGENQPYEVSLRVRAEQVVPDEWPEGDIRYPGMGHGWDK